MVEHTKFHVIDSYIYTCDLKNPKRRNLIFYLISLVKKEFLPIKKSSFFFFYSLYIMHIICMVQMHEATSLFSLKFGWEWLRNLACISQQLLVNSMSNYCTIIPWKFIKFWITRYSPQLISASSLFSTILHYPWKLVLHISP